MTSLQQQINDGSPEGSTAASETAQQPSTSASLNEENEAKEQTTAASADSNEKSQPTTASVDSGPIQAYAKLEGDDCCYYIRTLQVTLGRKVAKPGNVDIPLGNSKSVSRHHARLFYNFVTQRFEIMVFGKNGAFINEQFVEKGVTVPLENRTKIQIGGSTFLFLLPRMNLGQQSAGLRSSESSGYMSSPQHLEKHGIASQAADGESSEASDSNVFSSSKDAKPPFSYATLIAQAINSTEDKRMALHEIYNYITTHYPYYQMAQNGWQNSIRHNLSLNKAFVKVPRGDAEPGKGAFWTIDPKAEIQFMNGGVNKRTNKRPTSKTPSVSSDTGSSPEPRKRAKKEGSDNEDDRPPVSAQNSGPTKQTTSSAKDKQSNAQTQISSPNESSSTSASSTAASATATPSAAAAANVAAAKSTASTMTSNGQAHNAQQNIQAQIQLQLQTTIRQHLLDPVRYPLPPSIAQLLPQAIAQLPPHLASQFSATLQSALRAHSGASSATTIAPATAPMPVPTPPLTPVSTTPLPASTPTASTTTTTNISASTAVNSSIAETPGPVIDSNAPSIATNTESSEPQAVEDQSGKKSNE